MSLGCAVASLVLAAVICASSPCALGVPPFLLGPIDCWLWCCWARVSRLRGALATDRHGSRRSALLPRDTGDAAVALLSAVV